MTNDEAIKNGWSVCSKCGEIFANLVTKNLCWECDFLSNHPNAKKLFCKNCIHFRNHAVYDHEDKTECSCRKNLEAKTQESYHYTCKYYSEQETFKL